MLYRQTTNISQVHVLESQPSTAWFVFCLPNVIKTKLLRSPLRTIKKTALTKCFSLCLDICLHRNKMFLRKSYEKNLCVSLCYLRALFSITYFNKNIMHIGSLYLKSNRDFNFIVYPFRTASRTEVPEIRHTTFFSFC